MIAAMCKGHEDVELWTPNFCVGLHLVMQTFDFLLPLSSDQKSTLSA